MKSSDNYFKKSFAVLEKNAPALAHRLALVDPSPLERCLTQQKEWNLRRLYNGQLYYYHSPQHANQEAKEWFSSLDLKTTTVLFVYGVGLGYYYQAAQEWLRQDRQHTLVFLEEDLGVLSRLCETQLGYQLLSDPQVKIVYFQDLDEDQSLFHELAWTYAESSYLISSLKLYEEVNRPGFLQLQQLLSYYLVQKKAFAEEYLHYGVIFFRNFYPNLLELPRAYWGNGLFNRFSKVPAIICGAGPSLSRNMHLLSSLKDKALLFAGGSALNALIPQGIIPHFGVAIDPHQEQLARIAVTERYSIPFFYRNRLLHEALKAIKGPPLYLTGSGGYETAYWFEKELKIAGQDLDEGHNVVNFSLEIAHALGCNPIILIGVDLAFTHEQFYAQGVAKQLGLKEETLMKEEVPILREDLEGKPTYTLWKWVAEAEWISQFAERHPEVTLLNATEGGLGFKGIPNLSLQEVSQQFLTSIQDKIPLIDQEIKRHSLSHLQIKQIAELLEEMQTSLARCITLFSKRLEADDQLVEHIQRGDSLPPNLQTPSILLLETDIEQEIGYLYVLEIFNKVYLHVHHRSQQELSLCPSEKERALKQLELNKQRITFLRDVATCNHALIRHTLDTYCTPDKRIRS